MRQTKNKQGALLPHKSQGNTHADDDGCRHRHALLVILGLLVEILGKVHDLNLALWDRTRKKNGVRVSLRWYVWMTRVPPALPCPVSGNATPYKFVMEK